MGDLNVAPNESADLPPAWTPKVRRLLQDWEERANAAAKTHYAAANRLTSKNYLLGVPVVVFTTFVGTSVFATLQEDVNTGLRILVGAVSVIAAVLASLQTFLRYPERAEKHRIAGGNWSAIRRDINEMLALHPSNPATRGDPTLYLDDLRKRMDEVRRNLRRCRTGLGPAILSRSWSRGRRPVHHWIAQKAMMTRGW
jgi:hypothetical protein